MFLDDGLGGDRDLSACQKTRKDIKHKLEVLGFFLLHLKDVLCSRLIMRDSKVKLGTQNKEKIVSVINEFIKQSKLQMTFKAILVNEYICSVLEHWSVLLVS